MSSGGLSVRGLSVRGLTVLDHGHVVVESLDGSVDPGQRLGVVGGAASGAAALLEVLVGARAADAGTVERVRGAGGVTTTRREARESTVPGRAIGYVPQGHQLLGALTAVENVALVLIAAGVAPEPAWERAEQQLAALGLPPGSWHNLTEELSGGQQQRVSVARALIDQPGILVVDDPTSDLDATSAALVLAGLDAAVRAGSCLVIATNEPALVQLCDLVWRL